MYIILIISVRRLGDPRNKCRWFKEILSVLPIHETINLTEERGGRSANLSNLGNE